MFRYVINSDLFKEIFMSGKRGVTEVDIDELRLGPPYTCISLRTSDGNNPIESSNQRYVPYGQVVEPKDLVQKGQVEIT